jgi:hypothetical protein
VQPVLELVLQVVVGGAAAGFGEEVGDVANFSA